MKQTTTKPTAKSQALKDISKYIREEGKFVSHMKNVYYDTHCVTPSSIDTKETRKLNKLLNL